ncbi:MAG: 30S ribosomal protein S12 methylthiotransferase RimO [Phycisphaerae bacterium]|nr:30S ribosomal protein S12 methylthiotransferase RimO [Phycisphaerae bacterium]
MEKSLHVALVSLGCPKNLVDSESMLAALGQAGCVVGAPMDKADVIVINTCGFLAAARAESYDVIAEAVELKRGGRAKRVVVAGCLSTRDRETVFQHAPDVDAVIGVNDRESIVEAVMGEGKFAAYDSHPCPYSRRSSGDAGRFRLTPPHTAYLRIAEGCSQKCSFCTIPAIRGPLRSKPADMVLAEARELIADGAVELNVIAQDTTAWGEDFPEKKGQKSGNLSSLLRRLNALDGAAWIRLMYTYPRRFDDELIDAIASLDHVLPYIDMPLQHISTGVLRRMRRGVTRRRVETLLGKLRDRVPGLAIRTSFITGFPGETAAEFRELLDFVWEFQFDAVGVFEFSPEPGTPAERMKNQVPAEVAADRAKQIMAAQREIVVAANQSLAEQRQPLEVLVDGLDPQGRCVGRYYGQAPDIDGLCIFTEPQPPGHYGKILPAVVVGFDEYDLIMESSPKWNKK